MPQLITVPWLGPLIAAHVEEKHEIIDLTTSDSEKSTTDSEKSVRQPSRKKKIIAKRRYILRRKRNHKQYLPKIGEDHQVSLVPSVTREPMECKAREQWDPSRIGKKQLDDYLQWARQCSLGYQEDIALAFLQRLGYHT